MRMSPEPSGRSRDGVGNDEDVAGAVGALAMLDGNDVGRRQGFYGAVAAAGDDHDALVGDGVNGIGTFEESPEGGEDNAEANQEERQAKYWPNIGNSLKPFVNALFEDLDMALVAW